MNNYITLETALLVKNAGFHYEYVKSNPYLIKSYDTITGNLICSIDGNVVSGYTLAPTQHELQTWLREEKGIHVFVDSTFICNIPKHHNFGKPNWFGEIDIIGKESIRVINTKTPIVKGNVSYAFFSYNECLESALKQACKYLIDEKKTD